VKHRSLIYILTLNFVSFAFVSNFFFRVAVVTGANKGLGFEICKQLASNGIKVILGARDVKRGNEAVEKLKAAGCSDVIFHQLDVVDKATISSLANFIQTQFGKLDILVHSPNSNEFGSGVISFLYSTRNTNIYLFELSKHLHE
jgi:NAD(P)-dependent dehydrogenase (short-subunit alcohol dehydrogenase family)